MKALVAYFSASGVTARVSENLAESIGADIHAILIHTVLLSWVAAILTCGFHWQHSRLSVEDGISYFIPGTENLWNSQNSANFREYSIFSCCYVPKIMVRWSAMKRGSGSPANCGYPAADRPMRPQLDHKLSERRECCVEQTPDRNTILSSRIAVRTETRSPLRSSRQRLPAGHAIP